jgi:hypothetical protein
MRYGTWSDFTSKYGFGDGDLVKKRDVKARNRIVAMLNEALNGRGITAVAYDRSGLHDYCLVLILPNRNAAPPQKLLERSLSGHLQEVQLPPDIEIETIIKKAYRQVQKSGK